MPLQQLFSSLRLQIVKSFVVTLLVVLLFASITVEVFLVPSIQHNTIQDLTNSTRVLTNAVRASASIAIRNHLQATAEHNRDIARHYMSLHDQGLLSLTQVVDTLREVFLSQHVGTSGYIYCVSTKGKIEIHPNKQLLGADLTAYAFIRDQMRLREGYIEYDWKNPGELTARPKALYMVYFEPLDWIISASSYRSEFNELLNPDDFREAVLSPRFGDSGYAYILSQSGELLIHPNYANFNVFLQQELPSTFAREMLAKGSGSLEYEWRNPDEDKPRKKIAVYESIPEYGWVVASSSYLEEVLRPVKVARLVAYGSALLLLITAGLTSYFLSGKITRPVDEMMRQLDKNAREGVHGQLPVLGDNELGRLAKEFNTYLGKIDQQNEELRNQHKRYRNLFEASPDAVLLLQGLTIIDCNPSTYLVFQGTQESILGKTVLDLSPPVQPDGGDSAAKAETILATTTKQGLSTFEWVHQTIAGEQFNAEVRLKPFAENAGEKQFLAFVRNITDRKKALDALQKSELKYRQLVENATDAILIAQQGKIKFANSKTSEMTGYDEDELSRTSFEKMIHPDDLELVVDRHLRRLRGETDIPQTYTFRLITKDKQELTIELSTVLIEWNNRPATLNFLRDITEQRKMEALFQRAQKMEAIGTLAGGIAHDFNNLLMGIQGRVSLLTTSAPPPEELKKHLSAIEKHIHSATGLTKQLLGVARGGKYNPKPIDLVALVENSAKMFGRTRKELEVQVTANPSLIVVEADKPQIEQVLLNMFVNAWQAMPEGGDLRINIKTAELEASFCEPYHVHEGSFAEVSITDTGIGMDESICERIFDPFFTTKEKARGTGLGLASAYGIIRNHQGFITVNSELGVGSTFTFYLPLSDKTLAAEPGKDNSLVKGTGTVLIVDDEDMILEIGQALLEELGYTVIQAKGGLKAIEIMKKQGDEINLIILDLIMPDLDGGKVLDQIREMGSTVPVILSSGYSAEGEASTILQKSGVEFIQKPFNLSELSHKIRKALES